MVVREWSSRHRVGVSDRTAGNDDWTAYAREIGLRLQRARLAKGLSQERVAHLAGLAGFTYQKFEKGSSRPGAPLNPRLLTLVALCEVLDLELADLLEGAPSVND